LLNIDSAKYNSWVRHWNIEITKPCEFRIERIYNSYEILFKYHYFFSLIELCFNHILDPYSEFLASTIVAHVWLVLLSVSVIGTKLLRLSNSRNSWPFIRLKKLSFKAFLVSIMRRPVLITRTNTPFTMLYAYFDYKINIH
jgi:hypothetical protein